MKKQIEDEIEKLKTEKELILNDTELSLIDIDDWSQRMNILTGQIEALKWCLLLIK